MFVETFFVNLTLYPAGFSAFPEIVKQRGSSGVETFWKPTHTSPHGGTQVVNISVYSQTVSARN